MNTTQIIVIGAVGLIVVGGLAACQHERRAAGALGESRHGAWAKKAPEKIARQITSKMTRKLDLDDSQQAVLEQLTMDFAEQVRQVHTRRGTIHEQLVAEIRRDEADAERLRTVFAGGIETLDTLSADLADKMVAFHRVLNPDQRRQLATAMENHRRSHGCRFGRRPAAAGESKAEPE